MTNRFRHSDAFIMLSREMICIKLHSTEMEEKTVSFYRLADALSHSTLGPLGLLLIQGPNQPTDRGNDFTLETLATPGIQ